MWAVRTKQTILGTFDEREDAEQFAREWRSFHGDRVWVVRTER